MIWSKDVDIAIFQIDGRPCRSKLLALNPPDLRCKELWLPAPGLINSHHSTFTITAAGPAPCLPRLPMCTSLRKLTPLPQPEGHQVLCVGVNHFSARGGEFESDAAFSPSLPSPPSPHRQQPTWWGSHNCRSQPFLATTSQKLVCSGNASRSIYSKIEIP